MPLASCFAAPKNADVAAESGKVKFPEAFDTYAARSPKVSPQFFSAYVIEYLVFAASPATPCDCPAPTIRPMLPAALRVVVGNAVVNALFPGFVQTVGATPLSHAVKLPVVPDPSER